MAIKVLQKIGKILSTVIIVVLAIAILMIAVPKYIFKADMRGVLTSSMEPELPVGSLIVDFKAKFDEIQVGDDIVFMRDNKGTIVTHRVIAIHTEPKRMFTTQGIANKKSPDAPVSYENVIGKIKFHIPLLGYPFLWLSDLRGKIIAGITILALWMITLVISKLRTEGDDTDDGEKTREELKAELKAELEAEIAAEADIGTSEDAAQSGDTME
jgi:signal peptidase I